MAKKKLKNVALLPMKANSQRVPGKNFRDLGGKPLFRWILDTLLQSGEIDKVVINTDARDILEHNGLHQTDRVLIRDRKAELCGDTVSMNLIIKDDILAVSAETYLMTHTTNPFLSRKTIEHSLAAYNNAVAEGTVDSLFTVNRVQARFYRSDSTPVNHNPQKLVQTQDLEPWFEENSNLYIFSERSFNSTNARIGKRPMMHVMSKIEAIDIDTHDDWELAELLAPQRRCSQ